MSVGNIGILIAGFLNLSLFIKGLTLGNWVVGILSILTLLILIATFFSMEDE